MARSGRPQGGRRKGAGTKRSRASGRTSRMRRAAPAWLRPLAAAVLVLAFGMGFYAASLVVEADRTVRARFDGVRFQVPSRVYSAPMILYPGLDWQQIDLRATLDRLGYRRAATSAELPPGQYVWGDHRVRVHLRAFQHPTRPEPDRDIVLMLRGHLIDQIRSMPAGRELGAVLLEPESLGAYYGLHREQRELVRLDEVPRYLIDAVLAVEDQRFETHPGIDLRRIAGAMWANLRAGRVRQGGSTLTQQLVKNFFLTPERTFRRKLQEAVMALVVEARYDKQEILESYLNEIYLGQRGATAIHGFGEAAHLYFGKRASDLTAAESALLAAIIQSPNGISPYRSPERATQRRNLVLDLMHEQGRIDDETYAVARVEPLRLSEVTPDPGDARYFLDLLRRQLTESYDAETLTAEGLHIYSTLDRRLQALAAKALRDGLDAIEKRRPELAALPPEQRLQGCLVALRPRTGELLALVGGRDYRVSQFDRCTQARRQTGSVFKPFVYIAALEPRSGGPLVTLASRLDDRPLQVSTPSGPWRPRNYDDQFHDDVSVREALERSYNVATARLAQQVGIDRVIDVARRLGIESPLPQVPSLALGTAEVAPIELARAYASIASGGVRPRLQAVEDLVDRAGDVVERRDLRFERVLDPGTAYLATSLLEGVADRGTAAGIRAHGLRGPVGAKTGTTDEERDLWFVGFTPELVAVVWVGFDEPRSVGIPSSVGAMPIWRSFVEGATGGIVRGAFPRPPAIERVAIDPATGAVALAGCPESRDEYFLRGTLPDEFCPRDNLSRGGLLRWLRSRL